MNSWHLIVHTPDGCYHWPLGDPDPDTREDLATRARALIGFPPGDDWLQPGSGWRIALAPGEPHQQLGATERDVAELADVAEAEVAAWRAADDRVREKVRLGDARRALAALKPEERAALISEHQPRAGRPQ